MKIKNTFMAPCLIIVILALVTSVRYMDISVLATRENRYLSFVIIQMLIMLLPAVFYMKLKGKGYGMTLNMKMFAPDAIAFILLCTLMLIAGSASVRFVSEQLGAPRSNLILLQNMYPSSDAQSDPLYMFLAYALTPAIAEEFIFRGVMISEYRSGGRICAVTVSAILFAFLHYGFENFILAFFVGIVLAFCVYVTGSLWSAVFVRFVYNIYSLFLETRLFAILDRPKNGVFMIFIFGGLFLLLLFMTLSCAEKMFYYYAIDNRETPERNDNFVFGRVTFKNSFISLPFIFCVILYIIISI